MAPEIVSSVAEFKELLHIHLFYTCEYREGLKDLPWFFFSQALSVQVYVAVTHGNFFNHSVVSTQVWYTKLFVYTVEAITTIVTWRDMVINREQQQQDSLKVFVSS